MTAPLALHPDRLLPADPDDGLVMTLHPGVRRGHHGPTAAAGHLARLVVEHRLEEDEAVGTIVDLVGGRPREVFTL